MKFEEIDNLKKESERMEMEILDLLENLNNLDYESFDDVIQEEWYYVEQEALTALDRVGAKEDLERFISKLQFIRASKNN